MITTMKTMSHRNITGLDQFYYGAPYYPEHWNTEERAEDPKRMARAGFNVVRMAEFAWDILEPDEGRFDFMLFDDSIAQLAKEGLQTILCTPTATPPRWLTIKYPEVHRVNAEGITMQHGSRQHCCHTHPLFRQYSRRITKAMAAHYRSNPHVVGWQTDNEFNCHFNECHCPACQTGFREFLRLRYAGNIASLNQAWGTAFWALTYRSFEEITTPVPGRPAYENPAQRLDYFRFLAHAIAEFQHDQVELLRDARQDWFVTHNGCFPHIDYRGKFGQDLDFIGFDIYPYFDDNPESRRFSQGFNLDRVRSLGGTFMIPEHQSGPGGQRPYFHDNPEPGEIRRMTYTSIARGADSVLYFRWRTCRFGAEEYWCGVLDHDNVPRRRYREVAQVGKELKTLGPQILGTNTFIDCAVSHGDMEAREAHHTYGLGLPHSENMAETVHRTLNRRGYAVGLVNPADDLTGIKLYILSHLEMINPAVVPHLNRFVRSGGILVVGARCGARDLNNNIVSSTLPGCLRELVGATVEEYGRQNAPDKRPLILKLGESEIQSTLWYEQLLPDKGTQVLATWQTRHLAGSAAITSRKRGKGRVVYVGTFLTEAVTAPLVELLAEKCGLAPLWSEAPSCVEVVRRDGDDRSLWFFINHSEGKVTIPITPAGTDLLTGAKSGGALKLPAFGVTVIRTGAQFGH